MSSENADRPSGVSHFENASDFVEHLWRYQLARDSPYQQAIFRGQSDHRWGLAPSAYRGDGEARLRDLFRATGNRQSNSDASQNATHQLIEIAALSLFYKCANDQALRLPSIPDGWHQALLMNVTAITSNSALSLLSGRLDSWPPPAILPVIGLAQHYRVPTRLLDWTSDCHVAAYFAAKSAITSSDKGAERLAVWCTFRGAIEATNAPFDLGGFKPSYKVRTVEVPYAGNPNLAAQKGLFSVVIPSQKKADGKFDRTAIDEAYNIIRTEFEGHTANDLIFGRVNNFPIFIKATLPTSEAKELLRLLHRRGYDGSRLFPGYQGCEIAMQELELLEAP